MASAHIDDILAAMDDAMEPEQGSADLNWLNERLVDAITVDDTEL